MQIYADLLRYKFRELVIMGVTAKTWEVCDYIMEQGTQGLVSGGGGGGEKGNYFLLKINTMSN